jgi:hypothetical protein
MSEDQPAQETSIPMCKDNEQRLAEMRRQLESMFSTLDLVHAALSSCDRQQ